MGAFPRQHALSVGLWRQRGRPDGPAALPRLLPHLRRCGRGGPDDRQPLFPGADDRRQRCDRRRLRRVFAAVSRRPHPGARPLFLLFAPGGGAGRHLSRLLVPHPARARRPRPRRHAGGRPCLLGTHRRLCRRLHPCAPLSQATYHRGAAPVVIRNAAPPEPAPTPPSVTQPLVASLRGVWKVYNPGSPGEVTALAGIDLDISAGESVALVGPSGCGKSTLLAILGLLDRPTQGSVTIAGSEVSQASRRSLPVLRNRYIGFVFQHHHLLPTLTAAENVAVPLRLQGRSRAEALKAAGRWLDRLGLSHRRNHLPEQLSGGERQRVAVARALVSK